MQKIQKVKMVLPEMTTKTVWIGCYFNMYNAIVIFNKPPVYTKAGDGWQPMDYDYIDLIDNKNKHIIAGVCRLEEFKEWFPTMNISDILGENGNVISVEPTTIIPAELTAFWDDEKLMNFDFSLDGYQRQ